VDPISVVVLDPGRKSVVAGLVAREGLPVGPLSGEGPVEPFDFPVLPGAVRLDELLGCAEIGDGLFECGWVPVGERVVGDDPLDLLDAVLGEVRGSSGQESGRGGAFLVGVDLGIREAGVVIDRGMDVVETDTATADLLAAAVGSPAAAVGDPAEFFTSTCTSSPGFSRS
jgi:hypothetical protein